MKVKNILKNVMAITLLVMSSHNAYSQIRVLPSGNFVIGSNSISPGFKSEIIGAYNVGLGIKTSHTWGWGWAAISSGFNPTTKHWIVAANDYMGSHNFYVQTNGAAFAVAWNTISDSRFKENVRPVSDVKHKLSLVKSYTFDYKKGFNGEGCYDTAMHTNNYGFMAQEVQKAFPNLVQSDSNGSRLFVNYQGFIPLLLQYNKELDTEINDLNGRIDEMKREIEIIKNELLNCCENSTFINQNSEKLNTSNKTENQSLNIQMRIVPNPNSGSFDVVCDLFTPYHTYDIVLTDLTGKLINNVQKIKDTNGVFKISANGIVAGVYYVHLLQNGNIVQTQKAIINI
jgi:hypothetical protein